MQLENCPCTKRSIVWRYLQYIVVKKWSETYLFANHLTMRNYKHSNDDMGKMYIKIVANYLSFLVIPESPNHFPVGNRFFIWLADSKCFVPVRDRDWRKSPDLAQRYCSTLSIATVSLETKPNKGPSFSCCQGRITRITKSLPW